MARNLFVWTHSPGGRVAEGPWGPYTSPERTRTHARIKAQRGRHDVAVTTGPPHFKLVRLYEKRTGKTLVRDGSRVPNPDDDDEPLPEGVTDLGRRRFARDYPELEADLSTLELDEAADAEAELWSRKRQALEWCLRRAGFEDADYASRQLMRERPFGGQVEVESDDRDQYRIVPKTDEARDCLRSLEMATSGLSLPELYRVLGRLARDCGITPVT